ncbi:hypothetical protein [Gallaecimonas mangrovi]|uniref:hypothetical protein n=1 Tax=Gallaecimonas mangrovi TaxID=2291597 RepID=UPI000E20702F|nr:hypothetical protein [Gallaecimonas mangrovi]
MTNWYPKRGHGRVFLFCNTTALFSTLLALLIVGCSPTGPTEQQLKLAAAQHIGAVGKNSFLKVDKVTLLKQKKVDEKHLQVQLSYQLEFTMNFPEAAQTLATGQPDIYRRIGSSLGGVAIEMEFGVFQRGDKQQRQATLLLARQADNWILDE